MGDAKTRDYLSVEARTPLVRTPRPGGLTAYEVRWLVARDAQVVKLCVAWHDIPETIDPVERLVQRVLFHLARNWYRAGFNEEVMRHMWAQPRPRDTTALVASSRKTLAHIHAAEPRIIPVLLALNVSTRNSSFAMCVVVMGLRCMRMLADGRPADADATRAILLARLASQPPSFS